MMGGGGSRLWEFVRAEEKRGGLCNLTNAPGRPINLPQICANSTLPVPIASGAGNAILFKRCPALSILHTCTTNLALRCTP